MVEIANLQSFHASASGSTLVSGLTGIFREQMDKVLIGGRDITLHLPPAKKLCADCGKYNSTYKRNMGAGTPLCRSCKGDGFIKEQRQTVYRANIRWTNEPLDNALTGGQDTPAGRVYQNMVRIKTVIESHDHIQKAIGATIDGIHCKLVEDPRPTGWNGKLFYVISWWEKTNKKVGRG